MRRVFEGIPLSPGKASGKAVLMATFVGKEQAGAFADEVEKFFKALSSAKKELEALKSRISRTYKREVLDIIELYLMFMEDPAFTEYVVEKLREGVSAADAIKFFFKDYEEKILNVNDKYLRERAKDIRYVRKFLLAKLSDVGVDWDTVARRGEILVVTFISPVDVVNVAEKGIKGIVVEKGSETSHASILARSMGIPMVKLPDATEVLNNGDVVLVDGDRGVVVDPQKEDLTTVVEVAEEHEKEPIPVDLYVNIDFPEEAKVVSKVGAKGVGIFRTEYMYLTSSNWPTEEEQVGYLRRMLRYLDDNISVNVRIADLGGDKIPIYAEYMRDLISYRGIRFFMAEEDLFRTHVRAILKAFEGRQLRLLIPMVSDPYEVRWVKGVVEEELFCLDKRPSELVYGAMLETPAGVVEAKRIASEVDFVSVGTNDLVSLLYGIDRECELPEYLEPPNNLVLIEALRYLVRSVGPDKITLCGEVARNPKYLPYILKAGVKKLSVNPAFVPKIRKWLRGYGKGQTA